MKMLYILNVANRVNSFCMSSLIAAKKMDIEYHIAGNWGYANDIERAADEEKYGIHIHQVDFIRSPLDIRNYKAYRQLKELVKREKYDVIHCNTPIGGVLGRLVAKKCKVSNIIYQAHGFHFYKGSPLLNWLIYYPVEWICSFFTDTLITINQEDYIRAKKHLHAKKTIYVPGVGIDISKFTNNTTDKSAKRSELGIPENAKLLISVGELNENKNHKTVIRAIKDLDVHYMIAGVGEMQSELETFIDELGVKDKVHLLGFRSDTAVLYSASDIFVFPSFREGLSVALMEAMASGLPCAVSNIRGNTDLIDENGGVLFNPYSVENCRNAIDVLIHSDMNAKCEYNKQKIKAFSKDKVLEELKSIYKELA